MTQTQSFFGEFGPLVFGYYLVIGVWSLVIICIKTLFLTT